MYGIEYMCVLSYFDRLLQDNKVLEHPVVHLLCSNKTITCYRLFCSVLAGVL